MTDEQYNRAQSIKNELLNLDKRMDSINTFIDSIDEDVATITIREYDAGYLDISHDEFMEIALLLKGNIVKEIGLLESEFRSL